MGLLRFTRRAADFLKREIWLADLEEFSSKKARAIRYLKIALLTFLTFSKKKVGYRAVSLAYFSLMAFIPSVALVFAVTKGFGLGDDLENLLLLNFSDKSEIVQQVLQYAHNVIDVTNNGLFGVVSFLSFIWLVFWLMIQVEKAFNYVWQFKEQRNLWKRLSAYLAIVFLLPFVLVMFFSTTLMFSQGNGVVSVLVNIPFLDELSEWLYWAALYSVVVLVLTLMYKFIPGCKVITKRAFQASLIAALFFCLFQWIYVEGQIFFLRLNGVFGALAAIPFLMVWLNISWFIVLFGAELTYAYHHVESYNPCSDTV